MVGIYRIISPSGRVNIGQSRDINRREEDYRYISNVKNQTGVYNSYKKYGAKNHKFELLVELPEDVQQEYLDDIEIFYIKQYRECGYKMMNIKEGGKGGGKHTEESKRKMSESRKGTRTGKDSPMYGKPGTWLGKKRDPETVEKIRQRLIGGKRSEESKLKMSQGHKGFRHTDEAKAKISSGMKELRAKEKEEGIERKTWTEDRKVYNSELIELIKIDYLNKDNTTKMIATKYSITTSNLCNIIKRYLPECKRYKNRTWTKRN